MANIILQKEITIDEKLSVMRDDAAFDVCDTEPAAFGYGADLLDEAMSIKAKKNPPKVPKIYVANRCIFDCTYCCHRCANEKKRGYVHEPDEMARLAVAAARENGNGIFISSAIHRSPDYTEELIVEALQKIRFEHGYRGYIHAKIMPGADPLLIERAGWLADRLSINIELPKCEGYLTIARQKNRKNILGPMGNIAEGIMSHQGEINKFGRKFAKSGQSTQMIAGAMGETDRTIMTLSQALYKKYSMRRVYYSNYGVPGIPTDALPTENALPWRSRRLYQADRLIQLYNFTSEELLTEADPNLRYDMDPKAAWAVRNLHLFPLEINKAAYEELIRVPGIGVTWAKRILEARRHCTLTHEILLQMKISLKRAAPFILCNGKYKGEGGALDKSELLSALLCDKTEQTQMIFDGSGEIYRADL